MKKTVMMLMVSLFLVGMTSTAKAFVLYPAGAMGAPTATTGYDFGTLLASTSYNYTLGGTTTLGTITQQVYRNDIGLLFVYDFDRNATASDTTRNSISSLSVYDYSGFSVDALYNNDETGVVSSFGIRSSDSNLQFVYTPAVALGQDTKDLMLQTTAQYYTTGGFSLQGGPTQYFAGFAPTATPEPATAMLLGTGLLGLLGFRRKRTV